MTKNRAHLTKWWVTAITNLAIAHGFQELLTD